MTMGSWFRDIFAFAQRIQGKAHLVSTCYKGPCDLVNFEFNTFAVQAKKNLKTLLFCIVDISVVFWETFGIKRFFGLEVLSVRSLLIG